MNSYTDINYDFYLRDKSMENRDVFIRLDGFELLVNDMPKMIRFYRDVLGFEIKESEQTSNVYLVKYGTLFLLYGRKDFEKSERRKNENGIHSNNKRKYR